MRKWLLLICVLVQVGVLAYMVYGRESIVMSGDRIEIATAPIDPRDPFRGDFVRLSYLMNEMPMATADLEIDEASLKRDRVVYTLLSQEAGGAYRPLYMTEKQPSEGVFIKGRARDSVIQDGHGHRYLPVRYGIEQWFVEQGAGIEIEKRQGLRGGAQVPMLMEVALGSDGTAVLTNYRWGDVGSELTLGAMALEAETSDDESVGTNEPALWVSFENVSSSTVKMDNSPLMCNLSIVAPRLQAPKYEPLFSGCDEQSLRSSIAVAPGERLKVAIDLADPRWHLVRLEDGVSDDLRKLGIFDFHRIQYQHRGSSNTAGNVDEELWVGTVLTQSFSGRGRVD